MEEIFKNSKRIHDEFYLKEKFLVKESFKFLLENIKKNHNDDFSLIDIGCATGVFITYVKQQLPKVKITGADILQNLLQRAKINCPSADFYEVDVYDKNSIKEVIKDKKFDAVVLDGVHNIFDDVKPWVENLINILSDNGAIYVFGSFNESNFDIITRVKSVDSNTWEKGWNRFSLETVKREFEKNNFSVSLKKFVFDLDIEKTDDDRRTYTQRLDDGSVITRNGLELISTSYLITCKKKLVK
jgi:trans-aconitate methyltransferase